MGFSTWSTRDWDAYAATTATKPTSTIFSKTALDDTLNPMGVLVRESRDSDFNPESTPIIVGVDVTGSMGVIADHLVRKGLGVFFEEILARKPVSDPHMLVMGIGDAKYDRAPLQVGQFEADLTIASWLEKIYIEHGGGGNDTESYELPYYFAARHTSTDAWEKRGKKGYLFTIGDEEAPRTVFAREVRKVIGDELSEDYPFSYFLEEAMKMYNCYHIMIAQGNHARHYPVSVKGSWIDVMGQHAIWLEDYTKLSETMVSIIQVNEGENKDAVIKSWSGATEIVVSSALSGVDSKMVSAITPGRGIRRFV